jgi:hypothetical protein
VAVINEQSMDEFKLRGKGSHISTAIALILITKYEHQFHYLCVILQVLSTGQYLQSY